MASVARNFVLFRTDLFVFRQRDEDIDSWCVGGDCAGWFYVRLLLVEHIRQDCDPVMEDWGWTFAVSVDGVKVWVNVWAFFGIENCWLFGLESKSGWFRRPSSEKLSAAKEAVANAIETIMAADARFVKRAWFAETRSRQISKTFERAVANQPLHWIGPALRFFETSRYLQPARQLKGVVRWQRSWMNTKRPIIDFFSERLPEYRFVGERRPNLVFQCRLPNGIFRMMAMQRDSPSHGLAVELAATYNPKWSGEPALPLGKSAGLANLRLKNMMIEVMEHWFFYEPTPEGLRRTLEEIHRQFMDLAPAFFTEAENKLVSSRLLQLALAESRSAAPSDLAGIQQALEAAKYKLADLDHPAYVRLKSRLQDAWTPEVPKAERQMSNRIAYDCLLLALEQQIP